MCFTTMHRNNLNCRLGCIALEHCMNCEVINTHVGRSTALFNDIFVTVVQQKQAIKTFIKRKNTRSALLEGLGAYQGSTILDTSTPALEGGAGERSGLR